MTDKTFADRLVELQGDSSGRSFAQSAGLKPSTYQALLKGTMPTLDTLIAISQGLGVSISWLATGQGEKFLRPAPEATPAVLDAQQYDFALVPRLIVQPSAGRGSVAEHEDAVDMIAFQASWLRRRGVNPTFARALTVRGDSMEPTIRSGDVLLIDTSKNTIEDNGIYVVFSNGYVLVKRIHPRRDGSIMLISDNQAYPAEDVPAQEASDFRVAGRVMWFGRSI